MTLQDKFHKWLKTEPFGSRERPTLREAMCEEIAEEFAIRFCVWLADEQTCLDTTYKKEHFEELLEIYKETL